VASAWFFRGQAADSEPSAETGEESELPAATEEGSPPRRAALKQDLVGLKAVEIHSDQTGVYALEDDQHRRVAAFKPASGENFRRQGLSRSWRRSTQRTGCVHR
ncbi:unnamed protein product, partial [Symbiodinium natans]